MAFPFKNMLNIQHFESIGVPWANEEAHHKNSNQIKSLVHELWINQDQSEGDTYHHVHAKDLFLHISSGFKVP
jgi:hypothetical protein